MKLQKSWDAILNRWGRISHIMRPMRLPAGLPRAIKGFAEFSPLREGQVVLCSASGYPVWVIGVWHLLWHFCVPISINTFTVIRSQISCLSVLLVPSLNQLEDSRVFRFSLNSPRWCLAAVFISSTSAAFVALALISPVSSQAVLTLLQDFWVADRMYFGGHRHKDKPCTLLSEGVVPSTTVVDPHLILKILYTVHRVGFLVRFSPGP